MIQRERSILFGQLTSNPSFRSGAIPRLFYNYQRRQHLHHIPSSMLWNCGHCLIQRMYMSDYPPDWQHMPVHLMSCLHWHPIHEKWWHESCLPSNPRRCCPLLHLPSLQRHLAHPLLVLKLIPNTSILDQIPCCLLMWVMRAGHVCHFKIMKDVVIAFPPQGLRIPSHIPYDWQRNIKIQI